MTISPGTYIRLRREAVFLSIEEVAERFATEPRWPQHVRAEWLRLLEADATPATFATIVALQKVVPFSFEVLASLTIADRRRPVPPLCRVCACSYYDACIDQVNLITCHWVAPDLCSACDARDDRGRPAGVALAA